MGSQMPDETGCRFAVGQQQMLPQGVQPVNSDILVAKLRPGQIIDLEAHCIKGIALRTKLYDVHVDAPYESGPWVLQPPFSVVVVLMCECLAP